MLYAGNDYTLCGERGPVLHTSAAQDHSLWKHNCPKDLLIGLANVRCLQAHFATQRPDLLFRMLVLISKPALGHLQLKVALLNILSKERCMLEHSVGFSCWEDLMNANMPI